MGGLGPDGVCPPSVGWAGRGRPSWPRELREQPVVSCPEAPPLSPLQLPSCAHPEPGKPPPPPPPSAPPSPRPAVRTPTCRRLSRLRFRGCALGLPARPSQEEGGACSSPWGSPSRVRGLLLRVHPCGLAAPPETRDSHSCVRPVGRVSRVRPAASPHAHLSQEPLRPPRGTWTPRHPR